MNQLITFKNLDHLTSYFNTEEKWATIYQLQQGAPAERGR